MSLEAIDQPKINLEAMGFTLSPNHEVCLLERHLGLVFIAKPAKIILTLPNRLALIKAETTFGSRASRIMYWRDTRAHYEEKYNAYFCDAQTSVYTGLHENMHAYIYTKHPEMYEPIASFKEAATQRIFNRAGPRGDAQKFIVYRALNEGISMWGAVTTEIRDVCLMDESIGDQLRIAVLGEMQSIGDRYFRKDVVNKNFALLKQAIDTYQSAVNQTGWTTLRLLFQAESKLKDSLYEAGYYFSSLAMHELRKLPVREALTILLRNPPQKLAELRHPVEFVREKYPKKCADQG